jgi:hypothetical protein
MTHYTCAHCTHVFYHNLFTPFDFECAIINIEESETEKQMYAIR